MKNFLPVILAAILFALGSAKSDTAFSYKTHGNAANFFESEKEYKNFFSFRPGDTVAEVGAGKGENMMGFTRICDSVTFYVQDIDSSTLSRKNFEALGRRCAALKKNPTCSYLRCIGTVKETLLPEGSFDKIILISTFHEFTYMDEMMQDIYRKLKPSGRLYILDSHCFAKGHSNYTAEETISMLAKYGFSPEKKDVKDLHNSTGMYRTVFVKNK